MAKAIPDSSTTASITISAPPGTQPTTETGMKTPAAVNYTAYVCTKGAVVPPFSYPTCLNQTQTYNDFEFAGLTPGAVSGSSSSL